MYLSELKLWNFRKYSKNGGTIDLADPHLLVPFKKGINILIGENDSGKTAIIDAIKLVLRTHAIEWIRVEDKDFHSGTTSLRIELIISDMSEYEASFFTEWLSWNKDTSKPYLRLVYVANIINGQIVPGGVSAGSESEGKQLASCAREYLKVVYLKALRDASVELTAKKSSRISQILQGHDLFKEEQGQEHPLVTYVKSANDNINGWFNNEDQRVNIEGLAIEGTSNKEQIKDKIDSFLHAFINSGINSSLTITEPKIRNILEMISVVIESANNMGLGTMNRLYMATELLHLNKEWNGLKLCLIEELEAHLHPQAQMKVISALQGQNVQFILSTHSPNLASKIKISDKENTNIVLCYDSNVFPLNTDTTRLDEDDCKFLDHFLDVTKSNLFFAKGVIIVEGWAEELLIPVIADKLGYNLTNKEISIVNVGSTAYLRYANIFIRTDGKILNMPISIVTDIDVSPEKIKKEEVELDPIEYSEISHEVELEKSKKILNSLALPDESNVKIHISPHWTLEWCLYLSSAFNECFKKCVSKIHSKTEGFKMNKDGEYDEEKFKTTLINKLKNRTLDKVAIAHELCKQIHTQDSLNISEDDSIYYIVEAIKHVCKV